MSCAICERCGGTVYWSWEEAFDKFGFNDGDGNVMTEVVADVLRDAGYKVRVMGWGLHNEVIESISKDGVEYIRENEISLGYDDPRGYLPDRIVKLLDEALPQNGEVRS